MVLAPSINIHRLIKRDNDNNIQTVKRRECVFIFRSYYDSWSKNIFQFVVQLT